MQKESSTIRKHLTIPLLVLVLAATGLPLKAQFEQRLSVNLSGGYFNTIGWSGYKAEWWSPGDPYEPALMPNFKTGVSFSGGLQYNFSRHLSVEFRLGFQFSPGWYFDYSDDGAEPFNYLYYEIYADTITYETVAKGENYMDMGNYYLGLAPRYYFAPGRRMNPFIFAGVHINYLDTYFHDREYDAYVALGRESEISENTSLTEWFDYHVGIGFSAGAGAEFALNDYLGLFANVCYHFIPLNEESFFEDTKYAEFHALNIHLGARISFFRSKEL